MNRTTSFVFGNLWLLIALVLFIGGSTVRTEPKMVAFLGVGAWFYPGKYNFVVLVCAALGVWLLVAAIRSRAER